MKRSDAFKSNYLGKGDLERPAIATIKEVVIEKVKGDDGDEEKAVCHFTNGTKPMILNVGNWSTIEAAYGEESDNWRGRQVEVYVDPNVMFGRERVGGVRVRIPIQHVPVSAPQQQHAVVSADSEKRAAWEAFKAKHFDATPADMALLWKEAVKSCFTKPPEHISAAEWRRFVLAGFKPDHAGDLPVSGEPFTPEEIPF